MKVHCPGCGDVKNIANVSKFATFQCQSCKRKFKGFEARPAFWSFILGVLNPFSNTRFFEVDRTNCYGCGRSVQLGLHNNCYVAPSKCFYCGMTLDNSYANQDSIVHFVV